jgi:hypothetical protein
MNIIFELFGWVGAGLLLFAYYLSINKEKEKSPYRLPIINLIGSLLLMGNAIYFSVYPFVLINTFWAILSMKELIRLRGGKKE